MRYGEISSLAIERQIPTSIRISTIKQLSTVYLRTKHCKICAPIAQQDRAAAS